MTQELKSTYSQLQQDIQVSNFYGNKTNCYFVDIGANDGKLLSNTYLLEKKYNRTAICVEPVEELYNKLINCRECICDKHAISNESGKTVDFKIVNDHDCYGNDN